MDYQERHLCLQCERARLVYAPHLLGHTEKNGSIKVYCPKCGAEFLLNTSYRRPHCGSEVEYKRI